MKNIPQKNNRENERMKDSKMVLEMIHSPVKIWGFVKNRMAIESATAVCDTNWYFTDEGAQAYRAATTTSKKLKYFFDYLLSLFEEKANKSSDKKTSDEDKRKLLARYAFLMAAESELALPYSSYPSILKGTENPVVRVAKRLHLGGSAELNGISLLAELHGSLDIRQYASEKTRCFEIMQKIGENGEASDLYKLEKCILSTFCAEFSKGYQMPPYLYDIISSARSEDEDTNENDISDED